MRRAAQVFALAALAACAAPPDPSIYRESDRLRPHTLTQRPDYPGYGAAIGRQDIPWSPSSLAADFRRLMFYTEWGERVPRLMRWERPVRVALAAPELAAYRPLLEELVAQIRAGAPAIDLSVVDAPPAEITLRTAPRAAMTALAEDALCFFVPLEGDWAAFAAAHREDRIDWAGLDGYERITIFIPAYAAPHEIRSCILEEVTQALGPGNDLSNLGDSIYNDDNAHVWPTRFDLLMLRVLYDPALATGQDETTAARAATRVLEGLEAPPLGPRFRSLGAGARSYDRAIAEAAGTGPIAAREQAARRAVILAEGAGARDHRLGEAFKAAAFVAFEKGDAEGVLRNLLAAEEAHVARLAPDSPHLARVRSELAINLVNLDQPAVALALLDEAAPVFAANGADWQLAHALRWRAIAAAALGAAGEARRTALEALAWARYVYGGDSRAAAAWREDFARLGVLGPEG